MNEELESLMVRLKGDGSSYEGMLKQAQHSTEATARHVEEAASRIELFHHSIRGFGEGMVRTMEALGVERLLHHALDDYQKAERSNLALTAVLSGNGRDVAALTERYNEFSEAMERGTTLSHVEVEGLLRTAEAFGLTGEAAENAVKSSVAFSAAVTGSTESAAHYMRFAAAMEEGDLKRAMTFARMIPELRGVKDSTEFAAKATALLNTGWKTAQAEAESSGGSFRQLANSIEKVKEQFGKVVADAIAPFVRWLKEATELVSGLSPEIKKWAVYGLMAVGALLLLGPAITIIGFLLGPVILLVKALAASFLLLLTPWGLVALAVAGAVAAVLYFTDYGGQLLEFFNRQVAGVKDYFKETWEGIVNAVEAGDLELAFKIVVAQLEASWAEFNAFFVEHWNSAKDLFVDGTTDMTAGAGQSWLNLLNYMRTEWKLFFDVVMIDWAEFLDAVGDAKGADAIRKAAALSAEDFKRMTDMAKLSLAQQAADRKAAAKVEREEDLAGAAETAKKTKEELEALQLDAWMAKLWEGLVPKELPKPPKIPPFAAMDVKVLPKFEAAAWGSAEMASRIQESMEHVIQPEFRPFNRLAPTEQPGRGDSFGGGTWKDEQADNDKQLRDILQKIEENTRANVTVAAANVGDDFGGGDF